MRALETTLWEASGPLCSHGVFAQVQSVRLQNSGAPSSLSGFKAEDWMKMIKKSKSEGNFQPRTKLWSLSTYMSEETYLNFKTNL